MSPTAKWIYQTLCNVMPDCFSSEFVTDVLMYSAKMSEYADASYLTELATVDVEQHAKSYFKDCRTCVM
jgi:hypothetical protein